MLVSGTGCTHRDSVNECGIAQGQDAARGQIDCEILPSAAKVRYSLRKCLPIAWAQVDRPEAVARGHSKGQEQKDVAPPHQVRGAHTHPSSVVQRLSSRGFNTRSFKGVPNGIAPRLTSGAHQTQPLSLGKRVTYHLGRGLQPHTEADN